MVSMSGQQFSSMDVDDSESELDRKHHTGILLQRSIRIHREYGVMMMELETL